MLNQELVIGVIEENRIMEIVGESAEAVEVREYIFKDDARRNIAELGLGCNEKAVVTGNVLEDEKVIGMNWAFCLSEHIGGTVGVDDFENPANAVHRDFVYPNGGDIEITRLVLIYEDGKLEEIIKNGEYVISLIDK
jgi:hypothetical protein